MRWAMRSEFRVGSHRHDDNPGLPAHDMGAEKQTVGPFRQRRITPTSEPTDFRPDRSPVKVGLIDEQILRLQDQGIPGRLDQRTASMTSPGTI